MCVSEDGIPKVDQQLSLGEVLDLIPGDVVDGHPLVSAALQAAVDMEQQVHVIIPTKSNTNQAQTQHAKDSIPLCDLQHKYLFCCHNCLFDILCWYAEQKMTDTPVESQLFPLVLLKDGIDFSPGVGCEIWSPLPSHLKVAVQGQLAIWAVHSL